MRKRWGMAAACALALTGVLAAGGSRPATVQVTQGGVQVASVAAGSQFGVTGEGYKPGLPVDVCFGAVDCRTAPVDRSGHFDQTRSIDDPGGYTITVKQARNRQLATWDLRATGQVSVSP